MTRILSDGDIIEEICREYSINQKKLSEESGISYTVFSDIKSGKRELNAEHKYKLLKWKKELSMKFLDGYEKQISNEADFIINSLNSVFDKIETTPKNYSDTDNEKKKCKFLLISMNEKKYELLVDIDEASFEEANKTKQDYIKNKNNGKSKDYVLIPTNELIEIIDCENRSRKFFDEILSLEDDPSTYLDEEKVEKTKKENDYNRIKLKREKQKNDTP